MVQSSPVIAAVLVMTKKLEPKAKRPAADQSALRRRIRSLYEGFGRQEWDRCFAHVDPKLRNESRIDPAHYARSLVEFKNRYGKIDIWFIRASIHAKAKSQDRPFAYVYVLWQDDRHGLHLFRERWVKESGRWYTRVVGLVAHEGQNGKGN